MTLMDFNFFLGTAALGVIVSTIGRELFINEFYEECIRIWRAKEKRFLKHNERRIRKDSKYIDRYDERYLKRHDDDTKK